MFHPHESLGSRSHHRDSGRSGWFQRLHVDPWMVLILLMLCSVGLVVLYSASGHSMPALLSQMKRMLLGLCVMWAFAQAPPELFRAAAPWLYALGTVLLGLTLLLGDHAKGAQRWLDLGVIRFQPSEIMKLAMPLMIAAWLHRRSLPPSPLTLGVTLALLAVPSALVLQQPDLGTTLLILTAGGFALYFSGLSWRWIGAALGLLAALLPVLWNLMHDYQRRRVLTLLNPESDPLGAGYHITQSKIAIGSGGVFGKGWMEGTQAKLDFLPESHTDFIFAVLAEEWG